MAGGGQGEVQRPVAAQAMEMDAAGGSSSGGDTELAGAAPGRAAAARPLPLRRRAPLRKPLPRALEGRDELVRGHSSSGSDAGSACSAASAAGPGASEGQEAHDKAEDARRARGRGSHGCEHYRRRCLLRAPCCGELVACRHCHNEQHDHELPRSDVTHVVCLLCNTEQPVAKECMACGVTMGEYFCRACVFFDDEEKGQFHCDECGICRVGGADQFFHCKRCGCCYSVELRDKHTCVERSMHSNCPVCFDYLFDSVKPIQVMRCGHTIHHDCFDQLRRQQIYKCPLCSKSALDMHKVWEQLASDVEATPMPDEYADLMVQALCNDCSSVSSTNFHILGLQCRACGGFNTQRI